MSSHSPFTSADRRRRERGFSLLEVLIASLLLLFVALGVIPIFTMSMRSNVAGQDHTKAANYARGRLEELMQLRFDDDVLTVTAGEERAWTEYLDEATDTWQLIVGTQPDDTQWLRHTVIRQFDAEDLETPISADEASENPTRVQLKEITVEVFSPRDGGPLGDAKEIIVRAFKAA